MAFPDLGAALKVALAAHQAGQGAILVTVVDNHSSWPVTPGSRSLIFESAPPQGTFWPALDRIVAIDARDALVAKRSRLHSYTIQDDRVEPARLGEGNFDLFFEVLTLPPRLIIVGAGHIARPLARIAKLLEFEVAVLDDRLAYANRERFPDADQIVVGPYRKTLSTLAVHADTYIVLVTRGHVHDQACLEEVLESPAAYIGMIGSKRRVRTVVQHTLDSGHDPEKLRRVYAPIGLEIHAETPGEIAVAIMAEIVNVRRGGDVSSLALRERLGV